MKNKSAILLELIVSLIMLIYSGVYIMVDSYYNDKYDKIKIYNEESLVTASYFGSTNIEKMHNLYENNYFCIYDNYEINNSIITVIACDIGDNNIILPTFTASDEWYKPKVLYGKLNENSVFITEQTAKELFASINCVGQNISIPQYLIETNGGTIEKKRIEDKQYKISAVISSCDSSNNFIYVNFNNLPKMNFSNPMQFYDVPLHTHFVCMSNVKQTEFLVRNLRQEILTINGVEDVSSNTYQSLKNKIDIQFEENINSLIGMLTILTIITIVICLITVYLNFENNKKVFAIKLVLGAKKKDFICELAVKNTFANFIFITISFILSYLLSYVIFRIFPTLEMLLRFDYKYIVFLIIIPTLLIFVSNLILVGKLYNNNIIESLKNE